MKKFLLAGMLALGLFSEAKGQFCPSCIQNSAISQNAQFNVSSATIRGPLYVGSINLSSFTATSSITAPTFIGSGTYLTGLNASQLTFGTVSTNVVSGNYQGIAGVGVLTAGVWNAAILGSPYGGTGSNLGTAGIGSIPYFSSVGTMSTLSPGAATYLLQSNGAAPESWTNAPQVLGTNITAIPMANISVGSIPVTWLVSDVNISSVSAAKVIGNIPGNAANITGNLALTQLSTGTLVNTIVASSITVTGVTPGFWGGPNQLILENVGTDGRIVSISQSTFTVYASSIGPGPLPPSVTIAASQITSGTLAGNVIASSIAATGVQAGPYGYANQVSSFTVGVDGRLTLAGNIPIAINTNQINNGTLTPGVVVPAVNIQAGSLASNVIASSLAANGVAPGNYGGSNNTVLITVGANGLITSATTYAIPGLSSNTVQSNVDNAWTAPQTFFSSVTVHSTLGANFLTGDGSGVTNISPINIASGTLSANVVASSVSLPYLIVPSSVIASAFFGDGSHLSNLASTVAVTASLYGNGATATPLGVNSSSVAVLSGGFVLNSQLNPANNSIKSFSSLQTISSAYTALSSVTVDNNILSTGTVQALIFSDGAGTTISAGGVQATLIQTPAGAKLFGGAVTDAVGDTMQGGLIQDLAGDFLDAGTIQDVFGDKMQGGVITASTFNATGSAYQMHGKTFMDTGSNLTASSGTFSGTVVGSSSITASAFFGDGSHLAGVIASSAAVSVTASLYGDGTTGAPLGVQSSSVAVLSGGLVLNSQLNPTNNSIKTLSVLSLISNPYTATSSATNTSSGGLLVTSSVTAGALFGDGSHLTGISGATETVNASMTGVGTAANPLGVNSSSVAVLSGGLVLNSQLNPANNSITSLSALTTISSAYTTTSSMTNTSSQGILVNSSVTAGAFFGDASQLKYQGSQANAVPFITTAGSTLTFNSSSLSFDPVNRKFGIRTANPIHGLDCSSCTLYLDGNSPNPIEVGNTGSTMTLTSAGDLTIAGVFTSSALVGPVTINSSNTGIAALYVSSGGYSFDYYGASATITAPIGTGTTRPVFQIRTYGGSLSAMTAIPDNTDMGAFSVTGFDGSSFPTGNSTPATIHYVSSGTWSTSNHGTTLGFFTTPLNSVNRVQVATMTDSGAMVVESSMTASAFFGDASHLTGYAIIASTAASGENVASTTFVGVATVTVTLRGSRPLVVSGYVNINNGAVAVRTYTCQVLQNNVVLTSQPSTQQAITTGNLGSVPIQYTISSSPAGSTTYLLQCLSTSATGAQVVNVAPMTVEEF